MIDVKQAVEAAANFIAGLYNVANFTTRLEEVELSEDGNYWLITLSFAFSVSADLGALLSAPRRQYKVCKVDANTGQVLSMKIRELEHAAP
jgi:hypothetical protein